MCKKIFQNFSFQPVKQAPSYQTSTSGYGHFSCEEFGSEEKKVEPARQLELTEPVTEEDMAEIQQEFEDIMAEFSSNVVQVTQEEVVLEQHPVAEALAVVQLPKKPLEPMPEVVEESEDRAALPPQPGYKPTPAADDADDFETYTRIRYKIQGNCHTLLVHLSTCPVTYFCYSTKN